MNFKKILVTLLLLLSFSPAYGAEVKNAPEPEKTGFSTSVSGVSKSIEKNIPEFIKKAFRWSVEKTEIWRIKGEARVHSFVSFIFQTKVVFYALLFVLLFFIFRFIFRLIF